MDFNQKWGPRRKLSSRQKKTLAKRQRTQTGKKAACISLHFASRLRLEDRPRVITCVRLGFPYTAWGMMVSPGSWRPDAQVTTRTAREYQLEAERRNGERKGGVVWGDKVTFLREKFTRSYPHVHKSSQPFNDHAWIQVLTHD